MKIAFKVIMLVVAMLAVAQEQSLGAERVNVLAYPFPPYLYEDGTTGLTPDLIAYFNSHQNEYDFKLKVTTPGKRYEDFEKGNNHVMFFEMPQWGWDTPSPNYHFSNEIFKGGEVYIGLRKKIKGDDVSSFLKHGKIAAYEGYHYAFADFISDPAVLKKRYQIQLLKSHADIIQQVVTGKADIGIVTEAFLRKAFQENKNLAQKLWISKKYDQRYELKALVRQNSPLSVEGLESLFWEFYKQSAFQGLLKRYAMYTDWRLKRLHIVAFHIPNVIEIDGSGTYNKILQKVSKKTGIVLDLVVLPIARARAAYEEGRFDCLLPLDTGFEQQYFSHISSTPLHMAKSYIFTRRGTKVVHSLKELKGLKLGAERGVPHKPAVRAIVGTNLSNGLDNLVMMLERGRFDAIVAYTPDMTEYFAQHGIDPFPYDPDNPIEQYHDSLTCRATEQNKNLMRIINLELPHP